VIRDILVDPDNTDVVNALMSAAIDHLRERGTYTIRCVVSDPRFQKIMQRHLFVRMKRHEIIFLGNLHRAPVDAAHLSDIRRWHMTLGESDIFMFSGGLPPDGGVGGPVGEEAPVRENMPHGQP
jgi:hypothetical protein